MIRRMQFVGAGTLLMALISGQNFQSISVHIFVSGREVNDQKTYSRVVKALRQNGRTQFDQASFCECSSKSFQFDPSPSSDATAGSGSAAQSAV